MGRTIRHRLNSGGGRALNRAIHAIALTRMRSCPRTHAYIARHTAEGKTTREIRRCLKGYIARELCRHLTRAMKSPTTLDKHKKRQKVTLGACPNPGRPMLKQRRTGGYIASSS